MFFVQAAECVNLHPVIWDVEHRMGSAKRSSFLSDRNLKCFHFLHLKCEEGLVEEVKFFHKRLQFAKDNVTALNPAEDLVTAEPGGY